MSVSHVLGISKGGNEIQFLECLAEHTNYYHLVNRSNSVHNFFLICLLLFCTCFFGTLCAHHQEKITVPTRHLVLVTRYG